MATILRPSIVYSVDDNFTTNFLTLLNRLPLFPLYHGGRTKFMPIHCSDLTDIIYHVLSNKIETKVIECVGPEVLSFKEILQILLSLIDKKRFLLKVFSKVNTSYSTGVEMEALTACTIASLTIYDMCKSIDKKIIITGEDV